MNLRKSIATLERLILVIVLFFLTILMWTCCSGCSSQESITEDANNQSTIIMDEIDSVITGYNLPDDTLVIGGENFILMDSTSLEKEVRKQNTDIMDSIDSLLKIPPPTESP